MALCLGLTLDVFPIQNELFLIKLLLFLVSATYSPKTQNITLIKTLFNSYSAITCLTIDILDTLLAPWDSLAKRKVITLRQFTVAWERQTNKQPLK